MRRHVSLEELRRELKRVDGRGYKGYSFLRDVVIEYDGASGMFTRIQGDPYAPPSFFEIVIRRSMHGFKERWLRGEPAVALEDYLSRLLYATLKPLSRKCGTGNSCYMGVPRPSPRILRRSCVEVRGDGSIILRLFMGLPARGRRILAGQAYRMLAEGIPRVIDSVVSLSRNPRPIEEHITLYLDQEWLRRWVSERGYIAFVADGSILPRESSLSEKPLGSAVRFESPESLRVSVRLPSGRVVTGMALPRGIILVTGGGYHGKTTLAEALQDGIYDHVRGDGRELVITPRDTVFIQAEDGRITHCVDVSSFFTGLPGASTVCFSSLDASGSTSMASSIAEAIEAGCRILLVDEDTSATNLLFKDRVMERIITREPIRTLSQQARSLSRHGISLVVIASASSAFIPVADRIVLMEEYRPRDITAEAKREYSANIQHSIADKEHRMPRERVFQGIRGVEKVSAKGYRIRIKYSNGEVFELDLGRNTRIVERGQARLIAAIISRLRSLEHPVSVASLIRYIDETLKDHGFKAFISPVPPDLTMVSGFDVVWALNRIPGAIFRRG